jgi:hypothetical protein
MEFGQRRPAFVIAFGDSVGGGVGMVAPIFALLGVFGGLVLAPESIDPSSLAALSSDSFAIVGGSELMHLTEFQAHYPEAHADYIYGGLSWQQFRPRVAVSESTHGDFWAGAGVDYEKYWSINKNQAIFVGMSFLPGYYKPGSLKLGSPLEFRTQIEVGLVQINSWRISAFVEHRSNAGIGHANPGIEAIGANFGLSL